MKEKIIKSSNQRQLFSFRKYKVGLCSVLLGTALVFGASVSSPVSAAELEKKLLLQKELMLQEAVRCLVLMMLPTKYLIIQIQ